MILNHHDVFDCMLLILLKSFCSTSQDSAPCNVVNTKSPIAATTKGAEFHVKIEKGGKDAVSAAFTEQNLPKRVAAILAGKVGSASNNNMVARHRICLHKSLFPAVWQGR